MTTTVWVIVTLLLALGAGLAAALRRLLRPGPADFLSAAEEFLAAPRPPADAYRPMTRLFAAEDFHFLASRSPGGAGLTVRLRRNRARVLWLYLREMRRDFERVYSLARALALRSADPGFAAGITRQALGFYALWMLAGARCAAGWVAPVRVEVGPLVSGLERLREATRVSLASAQLPRRAMAAAS